MLAVDRLFIRVRGAGDRVVAAIAESAHGWISHGGFAPGAAAPGAGSSLTGTGRDQAIEPGALGRAGAHAAFCRSGARGRGLPGRQQIRSNSGEEVAIPRGSIWIRWRYD